MVKLFLDPNLKLSKFILCVVHTLHSVQEYRCTGVLVTCCDLGSMYTDMRPTAGALVQRHLAGREGAAQEGKCYFFWTNSNCNPTFPGCLDKKYFLIQCLFMSFFPEWFVPPKFLCAIYVRFGINLFYH